MYFNPLIGITLGADPNKRIGDQITITKLEVFFTIGNNITNMKDFSIASHFVTTSNSGTFNDQVVNTLGYGGSDWHFQGTPAVGPLNKEVYQFHKSVYKQRSLGVINATFDSQTVLKMIWTGNKRVQYATGTNSLSPADMLVFFGFDPAGQVGAFSGPLTTAYCVYFKDG